jgi:hypothetical protein
MTRYWSTRGIASFIALVGACLAASRSAHATLGGDLASVVDNDHHLGSTRRVVKLVSGERHDLLLPSGTLVHEYVSPAGAVYGVSWSGPRIPDLRELLGAHFAELSNRDHRAGGLNRLIVKGTDLVVQSMGHHGSFEGRAWVPSLVPDGVKPAVTLGEVRP